MAHIIRWDNPEKTVVFQQYTEGASKDDLYLLAEKSSKMLAEVSHTVHLIIDERNINLVLTSVDINYLEKNTPKNQGAVVMIVQPVKLNYKRLVQNMAVKLAPNAFGEPYFAETIEQAQKFLQDAFGVNYTQEDSVEEDSIET